MTRHHVDECLGGAHGHHDGASVPGHPCLTSDSKARKETPVFSGVLRYFPDAVAAVARVSYKGNQKHNPGEPLHWSRGKSDDHGDCIVRHQVEYDKIDSDMNEYHAAMVAWRALAQLQLLEEKRKK
jgi:dATP/dGTP diphosphohydrolase, N-terminal